MTLSVFIGWDARQVEAYEVAVHSLRRFASQPLAIYPLQQDQLRLAGTYTRGVDYLASTEFSLTRFLVPELMQHEGLALFVDSDVLFQADVAELFALADPAKAVQVVKHPAYPLRSALKMDGKMQHAYPRKWWSSVVLWNCGHPRNAILDDAKVNAAEPSWLHRFAWIPDHEIGSLPATWNVLVGYFDVDQPKLIHFTDGTPRMPGYEHEPYAGRWLAELGSTSTRWTYPPPLSGSVLGKTE